MDEHITYAELLEGDIAAKFLGAVKPWHSPR